MITTEARQIHCLPVSAESKYTA